MLHLILLALVLASGWDADHADLTPSPEVADAISRHFYPWDHERAVRVAWCESWLQPDATNPTSGAAGLFQHMPQYWTTRTAWYQTMWNLPPEPWNPYVVEHNVAIAAQLVYHSGTWWSHWNASRSCWR